MYRAFLAVYETKSMRGAAQITNTSQSAVSQNIKELSKQLGVRLFSTNTRSVEPTSDAVTLYSKIKNAIDIIDECEGNLGEFGPDTHATIRLSMPSTLISYTLIDFFGQFKKKYPNIVFEFFGRGNIEPLEQGRVDLVVDWAQRFENRKFNIIELFTEECIFIASKQFAKNNKLSGIIPRQALSRFPVVGHREFLELLEREYNLDLNIYATTATSESAYAMVKKGLGIGYYFISAALDKEIVKLEIEELSNFVFKTVLAHNGLTRAAQVFVDEFLGFCKKLTQG